jgi:hypothetical protein
LTFAQLDSAAATAGAGRTFMHVVAGLRQMLQEIEVENAGLFHSRGKSEELTKLLKKHLQLKKGGDARVR